jgi:hypothetical protein
VEGKPAKAGDIVVIIPHVTLVISNVGSRRKNIYVARSAGLPRPECNPQLTLWATICRRLRRLKMQKLQAQPFMAGNNDGMWQFRETDG